MDVNVDLSPLKHVAVHIDMLLWNLQDFPEIQACLLVQVLQTDPKNTKTQWPNRIITRVLFCFVI